MATPVIGDTNTNTQYYHNPTYNNDPQQVQPIQAQPQEKQPYGYAQEGQVEQPPQQPIPQQQQQAAASASPPPYRNTAKSFRGFQSSDPTFLFPVLIGTLIFFCWLITNLVLESGDSGAQFVQGVPPFVIQLSTFAAATCLAWYAINDGSNTYFLLSCVFNYIVFSMWFIHIVGPFGFFAWRKNDTRAESSILGACFLSPNPDQKLCDAFKATSVFSLFIMVIHFVWMILHGIQGISAFKVSMGVRAVLLVTVVWNAICFLIWWAGVIAIADHDWTALNGDEMTYIIIVSIAICSLLSILFVFSGHSDAIVTFAMVWHVATAAMLWSTAILLARTSDKGTKVGGGVMLTNAGGAIAAALIMLMLSHTISAVVFTCFKFGVFY